MNAADVHIGMKVTYLPTKECGVVKSITEDGHAFVVYNCAGEWELYAEYTGCRTAVSHLEEGWVR